MIGGTYQIKNIINNKSYYGSTNDFERREGEHFGHLRNNKHDNPYLQYSYNKEPKNFKFFIIKECNNALEEEQKLLDQYWDNCNNCYNIDRFVNLADNAKLRRGKNSYNAIKIKCYNENGILIKKYDCIREAAEEVSNNILSAKASISAALRNVKNSACGFIWRYENEEFYRPNCDNIIKQFKREIYQLDRMGNFLQKFPSIREAAEKTGINRYSIQDNIRRKNNHTGFNSEFIFVYKEDFGKIYIKPLIFICKLDLNNNIIKKYKSIQQAADDMNVSFNFIKWRIDKIYQGINNEFIWKREINGKLEE